jgi:hypothetical protein
MASARSRKSLSAEEILAETCAGMLPGGPSDVLSESSDDVSSHEMQILKEKGRNVLMCKFILFGASP